MYPPHCGDWGIASATTPTARKLKTICRSITFLLLALVFDAGCSAHSRNPLTTSPAKPTAAIGMPSTAPAIRETEATENEPSKPRRRPGYLLVWARPPIPRDAVLEVGWASLVHPAQLSYDAEIKSYPFSEGFAKIELPPGYYRMVGSFASSATVARKPPPRGAS